MKRKLVANGAEGPIEKNVQFIRNFEHIDGNWPSHVYLDGTYQYVQGISDACILNAKKLHGNNRDLVPIEDPHLSVSRPFVLRKHQISSFVTRLGSLLDHFHALSVRVPAEYSLLANDNNTRHFIALPVIDHSGKLLDLVGLVDEALAVFGQPRYYERPIFHISIASMLADPHSNVPDPAEHYTVTVTPSGPSAAADDSDDDNGDWRQLVIQHSVYAVGQPNGSEQHITAKPAVLCSDNGSGLGRQSGAGMGVEDAVDRSPGGVLGLLGDYSSDEECATKPASREQQSFAVDASSNASREIDVTGEDNVAAAQGSGKYSVVIQLTAVVCKIGNRVFRKELRLLQNSTLHGKTGVGTGGATASYGGFAECSG